MGLYILTSRVMTVSVSWRHPVHLIAVLDVLFFYIFLRDFLCFSQKFQLNTIVVIFILRCFSKWATLTLLYGILPINALCHWRG